MHARGTGNVVLVESRHPCLEAQDDVRFIPNDVSLMRGQSEFLIITGPNSMPRNKLVVTEWLIK